MLPEEIMDRLQVVPLERLKPHEETIPLNLQKLRDAMLNMGRLVDPIIVDEKNYVVLDGNHRRNVLELIKCPNAACQVVDYSSPEIEVGSWFPVSKTLIPDSIPDFKSESVDFETGISEVNKMRATFLYVKKDGSEKKCHLFDSNEESVSGVIAQQRKFLKSVEKLGITYIPDDKDKEYLDSGHAVLYRRIYTKDEIISESIAGRVMPPKSTRHMIPDRIIRLNMHLGWLSETPQLAKELMDNALRKRLTEGSIRRYTEPVIVLY